LLKFSQIFILIFVIIFGLGLITLGLKIGANQAIALVQGESAKSQAGTKIDSEEGENIVLKRDEDSPANPSQQKERVNETVAEGSETVAEESAEVQGAEPEVKTEKEPPKIETNVASIQKDASKARGKSQGIYKVIAGCFENPEYSNRRVSLLQNLGYPASAKRLRNYSASSDLNSVIVNRYDTYNNALTDISALSKEHTIDSYLIKKGRNSADGLTAYITMDISNPLLPIETTELQWMAE